MLRPSLPRRTRPLVRVSLFSHSHQRLYHTIQCTTNSTAGLLFYYTWITQYYTLKPWTDKVKTQYKSCICWCLSVDKDLWQHLSKGLWEKVWDQTICILTCVRVCVWLTDPASTLGGVCLLFELQRHLQQAILLSYERTGQHKAVASHSQVLQWVIPQWTDGKLNLMDWIQSNQS